MAYKKLKIICDADDVLISCNAYMFGVFNYLRQRFNSACVSADGKNYYFIDENGNKMTGEYE